MDFRVLGPLEVIGPAGPITIAGRQRRAILALLILHVGETVSNDRLINEVWGDEPPRGPRHAIEVHVARLRRILGTGWIESRSSGYRLRADAGDVDLQRFEAHVVDASRALEGGDPGTAARIFAAALALWRGLALADIASPDVLRGERARLDERRAVVLERWLDAELAAGRHLEIIPELRRIVDEMPLRETYRARLMLALYRSGRQAEALGVYSEARELLNRELGIDPGPDLEAAQRAVLAHDPGLAAAEPRESTPATVRPRGALERAAPSRRVVTIVVADVTASTLAGERVDPESSRRPLGLCLDRMRAVLEQHGGLAEPIAGDAVMAVFGIPIMHEDDALRAVTASSAMRDAIVAVAADLEQEQRVRVALRVGVNTGEVVAGGDLNLADEFGGDALKDAARLQHAALPTEILIDARTHGLVRSAVDAEPVRSIDGPGSGMAAGAFRLLGVTPGFRGHSRRFDTALIGRDRELRQLRAALKQATQDERLQLFSVLGPAGVGKSRLVHEFLRFVRPRSTVLRGRCLPYGERIALHAVAETVRQASGISAGDSDELAHAKIAALLDGHPRGPAIADRIAGLVGASEAPSTAGETAWAVRTVFEAVARRNPLVIVFDDVQWGDPAFLDIVESVAGASRGAPILLMCIARPELLEVRPGWGGGKINATSILLEPLGDTEVSRLVANLLGGSKPSAAVERTIVKAAEGNPLFAEEFLATLIDRGVLRKNGDAWVSTAELASVSTPPSIMALLAARLDHLPADERTVVEAASVIGKVFGRDAVERLSRQDGGSDLISALESLVRREIIRPDRSNSESADDYRFKHILIRDAAYVSIPKRRRIELHERMADLLANGPSGERVAAEEAAGTHLEQAYRYRLELGPIDDHACDVGRRAAGLLGEIGRRALIRGQFETAGDLLSRAAALLPPTDRERLVLLVDLAIAYREHGQFGLSEQANTELRAGAEELDLDEFRWRARVELVGLDWNLRGSVSPFAFTDLRNAIEFFERAGDHRAAARSWNLAGNLEIAAGHLANARLAEENARDHGERARDTRVQANAMVELATIDMDGGVDVARATATVLSAIAWARHAGALNVEATLLSQLARLKAMVGRFDEGRRLFESINAIYSELGPSPMSVAHVARWLAIFEWLAGDPVATEQAARRGVAHLAEVDERRVRSSIALFLAQALYAQGRHDEAYAATEVGESVESGVEVMSRVGWRGVRAMVLARRGEFARAQELAGDAVAMAETTDLVWTHAQALEALSEVLELSGRPDEARARLADAIRLYDQKGIIVLAERARSKQLAMPA